MEHDGCKGCAYESEGFRGNHCIVCEGTKQGDMYKRATNADRIRAMSDEDLAMNMMCPNENGLGEIDCDKSDNCNCYECILHWLQSEVE